MSFYYEHKTETLTLIKTKTNECLFSQTPASVCVSLWEKNAGMERSTGFKSWTCHRVDLVCCWFSSLLRGFFFFGFLRYSSLHKIQYSQIKFQFNLYLRARFNELEFLRALG